ncbi:DUF2512 family protein [Paenibacillus thermotolerans]|uniref:DUF2512 family protein n=1 Tax=Paenibacillus thermotolerans TaxID=3027807 RepID=UPI002367A1FB|nr:MULTISPECIES: DUF2512 family protein [unclassified Paenibacillus]
MKTLVVKFLVNGIVTVPLLLWLSGANLWEAIVASLALSITAYVIGDMMVLRIANNVVAAAADFGLAYIFLLGAELMMDWDLSYADLFWISLAVGVVELWYHRYFEHVVLKER